MPATTYHLTNILSRNYLHPKQTLKSFSFRKPSSQYKRADQKGHTLIELTIVIALSALVLPVLISLTTTRTSNAVKQTNYDQAQGILLQMQEATRNIRDQDWDSVAIDGQYHPIYQSGWMLNTGQQTSGEFTSYLEINTPNRDANGSITTSGGNPDPATKIVNYYVVWNTQNPSQISSTDIFTNTKNLNNQIQTTQGDFSSGQGNNVQFTSNDNGEIQLQAGSSTGIFTDTFSNPADYSYDTDRIEVSNDFAQLKNLSPPATDYLLNPSLDSGTAPWQYSRFYWNVGQVPIWYASGGNPDGNVRFYSPASNRRTAGGYGYQTVNVTNPNQTYILTFDYRVEQYEPTPDNFQIYTFVDRNNRTPNLSQNVWSSGPIVNTSSSWNTVNIDVSDSIRWSSDYTIKLAMIVDYAWGSNHGPYSVSFDNVQLTSSGQTPLYADNNPAIAQDQPFSDTIQTWQSFTEIANFNGGNIGYQLSIDGGNQWLYFRNGRWREASNDNHYNTAQEVNNNISQLSTSTNQIQTRALLQGNGTQQVQLDQIEITYQTSGGGVGNQIGTYVSPTIDLGQPGQGYRLEWNGNQPSGTTVSFQIGSSSTDTNWQYIGPDGTSNTYFTSTNIPIPIQLNPNQYFRYRIRLETTNSNLPSVHDVNLIYSL